MTRGATHGGLLATSTPTSTSTAAGAGAASLNLQHATNPGLCAGPVWGDGSLSISCLCFPTFRPYLGPTRRRALTGGKADDLTAMIDSAYHHQHHTRGKTSGPRHPRIRTKNKACVRCTTAVPLWNDFFSRSGRTWACRPPTSSGKKQKKTRGLRTDKGGRVDDLDYPARAAAHPRTSDGAYGSPSLPRTKRSP